MGCSSSSNPETTGATGITKLESVSSNDVNKKHDILEEVNDPKKIAQHLVKSSHLEEEKIIVDKQDKFIADTGSCIVMSALIDPKKDLIKESPQTKSNYHNPDTLISADDNTILSSITPVRPENSIPTKELLRGAYCSLRADGVVDLERMKVLCRQKNEPLRDFGTLSDTDVEMAFFLADPGNTGFLTFRRFLRICVLLDAELDQRDSTSKVYTEIAGQAPGLTLPRLLEWPDLQSLCQSGEISESLINEVFQKYASSIGATMYLSSGQFSKFLDSLSATAMDQ